MCGAGKTGYAQLNATTLSGIRTALARARREASTAGTEGAGVSIFGTTFRG